MRDDPAFLKAILEAPEDDTLRLVYADWLQENGQSERAEYIRVECELATIHDEPGFGPNEWDRPRFWELDKRARALYKRHAPDWFAALSKAHRGEMSTRRGFPYHAALSARAFIARGAALFRAAPTIEDVFIYGLGRHMPQLARTPALGHVRHLTFFETPFRTPEAQQFAASPHLGNLRSLEIGFTDTEVGAEGAIALSRAKSVRQLQKLDIGNHAIRDTGAEHLIHSERLATLTDLHFGQNELTDTTTAALSWADHLKLTALNLMHNELSGAGLVALQAPHLSGLERLSVHGNSLGRAGAVNLASAPFAARMRQLLAANCDMDDKAVAALLDGAWPQLSELNLAWNAVGSRAAKALTANRSLLRLEDLSVAACEIGPTAARALGRASLPALRTLDAPNNPLGPNGVRALLAGPLVRTVETLDLDATGLGDDGAEVLARSPAVANVRWLQLRENRITNRGAKALAESPHLERVQSFDLDNNKIGKKGREALTRRFGTRVDFGDND